MIRTTQTRSTRADAAAGDGHPAPRGIKTGYLTNMYPKVSHTFIRREIAALESMGLSVERFSIRPSGERLVDEADRREQQITRVILARWAPGVLLRAAGVLATRPVRFLRALLLAVRSGWRSDRGILVNLAYLAEACVLLGWSRKARIEHLHAHFGTNPAAVAMLCRELGGPPYSFTVHGPGEFDRAPGLALDEKIARAAFVVAISDFGRSQLYRWSRRESWSKIHIIRCGLNGAFLKAPHSPVPPARRLVCVGRLSEEKGQLLLIEAAHRLIGEGGDLKLALVGDGPLRAEIEELIDKLELRSHVEITGWVSSDQVRREMLNSRALVLPSFAEGLPVVLMEALALGRPAISTFVAGIPELVQPGVCGWLVPAGSLDSLVSAMREALRMPVQQLEKMGRAGAARVAELHNARTEAEKLAALFRNAGCL